MGMQVEASEGAVRLWGPTGPEQLSEGEFFSYNPPPWVSYDSNFAIYVSRSRRSNTQLSDHLLFQSLHHKPYSCMMSRVMVVGRHVSVHL